MLRLLGLVVSVGLADSLNPSTVGPALFLAAERGAVRKVLAFAASTFVIFLLGGLLLTLGPGRAILALVPRPDATVRYVLETAVGAALLIATPFLWRKRRTAGVGEAGEATRGSWAGRSPVLLGASLAVVELPTAFPYLAVVAAITGSGLSLPSELILVAVYNLCFVLPLLLVALAVAVGGDAAVARLRRIRGWLRAHWPAVASGVALLAGLFVIVLGITGLTGRGHGHVGHVSRQVRHLITHPTGG
jgi:cytochrome c biogenesis protein CcdA